MSSERFFTGWPDLLVEATGDLTVPPETVAARTGVAGVCAIRGILEVWEDGRGSVGDVARFVAGLILGR